jgi:hypothetical protein
MIIWPAGIVAPEADPGMAATGTLGALPTTRGCGVGRAGGGTLFGVSLMNFVSRTFVGSNKTIATSVPLAHLLFFMKCAQILDFEIPSFSTKPSACHFCQFSLHTMTKVTCTYKGL